MRCSKETFLKELKKIKEKLIIVEGKKDMAALVFFGLKNIVILKKGIFETCEDISKTTKEVVILTDLDSEGKKIYSMIYENLMRNNVKIDNKFRVFLFRETGLRQIEGMISYFQKLED